MPDAAPVTIATLPSSFPIACLRSVLHRPAIDHQALAGDEIAVGRGEEDTGADDILGQLLALDGAGLRHRLAVFGVIVAPADILGRGEARRDGVDADAVLAELGRKRPRHAEDRAFGRDIVQHHRRAVPHRARGDVDDLAVILALHDRHDRLDAEEHAADIDGEIAIPFLGAELRDGYARHARKARIVDEDMDAAISLFDGANEFPDRGSVRDIADHAHRGAARRFDFGDDPVGRVEFDDRDLGALGGKTARVIGTDTNLRAGDDRNLAVEPAHDASRVIRRLSPSSLPRPSTSSEAGVQRLWIPAFAGMTEWSVTPPLYPGSARRSLPRSAPPRRGRRANGRREAADRGASPAARHPSRSAAWADV